MAAAVVGGVRVDPTPVVFTGVKVGQVYRTNVTVTNVGRTSKTLKLGRPLSKVNQCAGLPAGYELIAATLLAKISKAV